MRLLNLIKPGVTGLALLMPVLAHAEWWTGGYNGSANVFLDVESIRVVERVEKTKAWIVYVPESDKPKPTKGNNTKSRKTLELDPDNTVIRMLMYVDCSAWTAKRVQTIVIDKRTGDTLHTLPAESPEYGYEDIDTSTLNHSFAKIMCSSNVTKTLRELDWWPIETTDLIAYSAKYMRVQNWILRDSDKQKKGKQGGAVPDEVIEVLRQMKGSGE